MYNSDLLQLLQNKFCVDGLASTDHQNIWIMAAAITPYPPHSTTHDEESRSNPSHTVRIILRTTDETGTNVYVDGTDIYVRLDDAT